MLNPTLHFKHLSTFHSIVVLFLLLTVRGSLSDGSEFPLNLKKKKINNSTVVQLTSSSKGTPF